MASTKYIIDSSDLQCAICLEPLVKKDPRMLPCQHTFCLSCLTIQERNNKLNCAICRTPLRLPGRGAKDLAKNIFFSHIREIKDEIDICKKHDKLLLKPSFYCRKCCTRINCFDCLRKDHSLSECRVLSTEAIKRLNIKCFEKINQQREKNRESLDMILEKFKEHKKSAHEILDQKYLETENKIKEYFGNREHELRSFINRADDVFVKEKLYNDYLQKISTENIVIDEIHELALDHYIRIIDKANNNTAESYEKQLLRLRNTDTIPGSKVSISNDGAYYLPDSNSFHLVLNCQSFTDNETCVIDIDKEVSDILVTKSYVFALNENNHQFYCAPKNVFSITMELYCENVIQILSIKESEDDVSVLVLKTFHEVCLFLNSQLVWKKQNYTDIIDATILANGNVLAILKTEMLIEHDKITGNQIRAFPSCGLRQITSTSDQVTLILFDVIGEENETVLYYVDENFCQHRILDGDIERIYTSRESNYVYVKFAPVDGLSVFKLI